jgi:hypothetical protein
VAVGVSLQVVPKVPRGLSGEGGTHRGVREKKGHKQKARRTSPVAEESTGLRKDSRSLYTFGARGAISAPREPLECSPPPNLSFINGHGAHGHLTLTV